MYTQISALLVAIAVFSPVVIAENERLRVGIYYETLCPDSMRFIRQQLYPAMMENNWLPYTDLHFIPYGKVSNWTDPETKIKKLYCQHGTDECEKNALHACIVENNSVEEQLLMFNCLLRGYRTDVDECARSLNVNVDDAKACKATRSTVDILEPYGVATSALDITFVPTITIDSVFDPARLRNILYNFEKVFCRKYQQKFNVRLEKC